MKTLAKYLLTVFFFFIFAMSFSQIPNASFENWNSMGSYRNPAGWGTMNNTTVSSTVFTANRGTNSDSTRFLKLSSKTIGASVVRGVAVSGKLDTLTLKPISGFAFSQQPDSLVGRWVHMSYGGDPGMVSVALTRWNNIQGKRDTVAFGCDTLGTMAMTFVPFGVKLTYLDFNPPDSCIIYLASSGTIAKNNDYLFIDSLSFAGNASTSIARSNFLYYVSLYPNPASNFITLSLDLKQEEKISIQLTDLAGKLLREKNIGAVLKGKNIFSFDISGTSRGNYLIKIISAQGIETSKIIIE